MKTHLPPLFLFVWIAAVLTACRPPESPTPATNTPLPTETRLLNRLPPTWTPTVSSGPQKEPSPTPFPTATPFPTSTAAPTLAPPPTPFPPIYPLTAEDHPLGSGGLFFLKDGQPWVWDRQSGEVSLYQLFPETSFGEEEVTPPPETAIPLGDVLDVETATKSGQVLFLRQESSGVFELLFAELNTARLQWRITVEASNLFELALSPDGRWLAYLTSVEGGEAFAQLVLLSTEDPQRSQAAAICETICADLLWTPDGARLVWADSDGVWGLALPLGAESQPESLAPQVLPSESPLSPVAFSPSGRFLLLESQGERADRWLLDTGSQRLEAVPGSFFFVPPAQSMTWLPDDRLLITRGGHKTQGLFPTLEIWRVNPQGEGSLFEMEFSMEITDSVSVAPLFPAQLPDGRLAFGLMNFSTPRFISTDGVYLFDGESESLVKVNDLPVAKYQEALWLPDGSAVMLLTSRRTLYVPLDGGRIYDLRLYLGVDACCFTWVSSP